MPESTESVELAKGADPDWQHKSIGQRAAVAIHVDVMDRCGIQSWFGRCEPDVTEQILRSWAEIVNLLILQSSGLLGDESH